MDDLGNRTNVNLRSGSNQVYDVNDLTNRYNSIDYNNLSYDDAGNLATDAAGYQYTYDYENRLIGIKDSGNNPVATFTYDALGRRIEKYDAVADETTRYYNNHRWQVLAEYDAAANLQRYFVYGNYIDEVLMMTVAGQPNTDYYYAHDHLYSPAALLDANGNVLERYEYNAYGKVTRLNPNFTTFTGTQAGNPYYFTGRQLDTLDNGDLELMYYRNRSYDPATGRFLQHDPHNFIDGLNLYQYVSSAPCLNLDPYGYSTFGPGGVPGTGGNIWGPPWGAPPYQDPLPLGDPIPLPKVPLPSWPPEPSTGPYVPYFNPWQPWPGQSPFVPPVVPVRPYWEGKYPTLGDCITHHMLPECTDPTTGAEITAFGMLGALGCPPATTTALAGGAYCFGSYIIALGKCLR